MRVLLLLWRFYYPGLTASHHQVEFIIIRTLLPSELLLFDALIEHVVFICQSLAVL